jgi:hypothetical protein
MGASRGGAHPLSLIWLESLRFVSVSRPYWNPGPGAQIFSQQTLRGSMLKKDILPRAIGRVRRMWAARSNSAIFSNVYERRLWGSGADPGVPFYSGIGSYDPSVKDYIALVTNFIQQNNIGSVIEIGCGDFAIASQYAGICQSYLGVDVVKSLVQYNQKKFGSGSINFVYADASKSRLGPCDLCVIRQVLQHLSNHDISKIFRNVRAKFMLVTEHLPAPHKITSFNLDKQPGADIWVPRGSGVFIDKPPFSVDAKVIMDVNVTSDIHDRDERFVTWLVGPR